ncbi:hypothetical protein [Flavobacterium capsici]|uniref:Right-handed parallel beta-helix repeat-containing protein n=1 Tax=Flavobacterium capsici TaxID=3075618 RepID=A0AA96EXI0_9FLAO|nr:MULTISPECIES: hypothetical protein [unclassified Flavobacterium]WNM18827.1 hypothetical protein RN608_12540 [Flavobacterium sp. PMR2A8]WNM22878.1 hypothetical protein RN605_05840 [Flavobacterium sp. PMTSA4]
MRNLIILLFIGFAISLSSCRQDFVFEPSTGDLTFSKDTIYLDTVFTNIGSSTYTLKVYNRSNKDIKIPLIKLGKDDSKYRMTVDGMTGENNRVFRDVEMLAKDSMYIFVEVTADVADSNPTDFLYTDQIQFDTGSNFQKVELVTLIQDAYFIYPNRTQNPDESYTYEEISLGLDGDGNPINIRASILDENDPVNGNELIWNNSKPYVVYGYAVVPDGKSLQVQPGARIHFHADSGLIVGTGASLKINGELSNTEALENEVIFEGDRLEPLYSDVPGQWGTIWLTQGSTGNEINYATIKNATVGLLIDSNDGNFMTIKNTQIYDSSNLGIYAKTAKIKGENIVINTAGVATLACTLGGNYEFKHCTFNNNWSSSKQVAVLLNNYYKDENNAAVPYDLVQADFINCIIYGSNTYELTFDPASTNLFNYTFTKCLMKFGNSTNTIYASILSNPEIIRNESPKFLNIIKNKLNIGDDSAARGIGIDANVPNDILGMPRTSPYDLGAYNWITFPEEN